MCRKELLTAAAADTDGDQIVDPFDNCPLVANVDQLVTATVWAMLASPPSPARAWVTATATNKSRSMSCCVA